MPPASRSGAAFSCDGLAEVDEADEAFSVWIHADRLATRLRRAAPRACASSRRGRERAPPAARCRRRRRSRAGPPRPGPRPRSGPQEHDDQGRRAIELGRRLRPGGLLQPLERLRPEHPEAPGVGQVVVRRPAGELEQLVEGLSRHRRRAGTPCACGDRESPRRRPSALRLPGSRRRYQRKPPPSASASAPSPARTYGVASLLEPPPPTCSAAGRHVGRGELRLGRPVAAGLPGIALPGIALPGGGRAAPVAAIRPRRRAPSRAADRSALAASGPGGSAGGGRAPGSPTLGTRPSGNARRFTASSACEVTQTGVWSLDAE